MTRDVSWLVFLVPRAWVAWSSSIHLPTLTLGDDFGLAWLAYGGCSGFFFGLVPGWLFGGSLRVA